MARSEHNREAYRSLFGYVGGGLQAFAVLMILVSFPIAPAGIVVALLVASIGLAWWSWRKYDGNFMMPTFAGVVGSVLWLVVIGGGALAGWWGP